jgi:hypothetical protein
VEAKSAMTMNSLQVATMERMVSGMRIAACLILVEVLHQVTGADEGQSIIVAVYGGLASIF